MIWTKEFWQATLERAIKTFAQSLAALLTGDAVGILDADWGQSASVAAMATILSILSSVGSSGIGNSGPSLSHSEVLDVDGRHEAE